MEVVNNGDLEQYRQAVKNLADSQNAHTFTNSGRGHAAIVLSNILDTAFNEVCVFAQNMNGDISGQDEYLRGLKSFMNKGGKIKLLLEKNPPEDSKAFALINNYKAAFPSRAQIKYMNSEQLKIHNTQPFHFTVADGRMYRIETDIENYLATCCFNDKGKSEILTSYFDTLFKSASEKTVV